jgi:adenylate cyclase class 1
MQVVDAKRAFLDWSEKNFEYFVSKFSPEQQSAFKVLPLLFQVNDRLLPGYNGMDTPAGIYGYVPTSLTIKEIKKLYGKFKYEQKKPLKNTIIESVYLQADVLNEKLILWIVHIEKLKPDRFDELENKISRIKSWLRSQNLSVNSKLLTAKRLSRQSNPAAVFLDDFYYQSFLLAGKYPVWWLVPAESEGTYNEFVEHIKTARFVNVQEFIDLGGVHGLGTDDFLKLAIKYIRNIYKAPDLVLLRLLLLTKVQRSWPKVDGLSCQLKRKIYLKSNNREELSSTNIVCDAVRFSIEEHFHKQPLSSQSTPSYPGLFAFLSRYTISVSASTLKNLSADFVADLRALDIVEYMNYNRRLYAEIQSVYLLLLKQYDCHMENYTGDKNLQDISKSMLNFISGNYSRVPVYIAQTKVEFVLGRVLLKHNIKHRQFKSWSLVVEKEDGIEKEIANFDSLLKLILWAWLNRIVDRSTQVSIQCSRFLVKQIDAYHVLEILIQNIAPDVIADTSQRVFERANKPLRSLLFFNMLIDESQRKGIAPVHREDDPLDFAHEINNLLTSCEQIVINSWGDVHIKSYASNEGVLQCLCDWMCYAPLSYGQAPRELKCFGYASGESVFLARRIEQIYVELVQFFYYQKQVDGCFIVRIGNDYCAIYVQQDYLQQNKIGYRRALYPYLEQANKVFKSYALERLALPYVPLREIFQRNKKDVIQVFFQSTNRSCETWVLDEKGSLCYLEQSRFDRRSYITHWLYLMRNISKRLKKISYQQRALPTLEIFELGRNQLGDVKFHPVGSEAVNKNKGFVGIQLEVCGDELTEQISLICEGKKFGFEAYGENVIAETVKYISAKLIGNVPMSVYITDIEAPFTLYGVAEKEDIQLSHFLKYIRNIETRINKLLYG